MDEDVDGFSCEKKDWAARWLISDTVAAVGLVEVDEEVEVDDDVDAE